MTAVLFFFFALQQQTVMPIKMITNTPPPTPIPIQCHLLRPVFPSAVVAVAVVLGFPGGEVEFPDMEEWVCCEVGWIDNDNEYVLEAWLDELRELDEPEFRALVEPPEDQDDTLDEGDTQNDEIQDWLDGFELKIVVREDDMLALEFWLKTPQITTEVKARKVINAGDPCLSAIFQLPSQ